MAQGLSEARELLSALITASLPWAALRMSSMLEGVPWTSSTPAGAWTALGLRTSALVRDADHTPIRRESPTSAPPPWESAFSSRRDHARQAARDRRRARNVLARPSQSERVNRLVIARSLERPMPVAESRPVSAEVRTH